MQQRETVIVLDFGGQLNQLIARRVRQAKIYCEVMPYDAEIERIQEKDPKAIIMTGGFGTIYDDNAPKCDKKIFNLGVPVLAIGYTMEYMNKALGGEVNKTEALKTVETLKHIDCQLFDGVAAEFKAEMNRANTIEKMADGFERISCNETYTVAAMQNTEKKLYATQFLPESKDTEYGIDILKNFLYTIAKIEPNWTMKDFAQQQIEKMREIVGDKKVICALSGGVDSSVSAALLSKAIGKNLTCILVDHGLMRKNEADMVEKVFAEHFDLNFIRVDASDRFLKKLEGVTDPEKKRKIIGEEFIRVFEDEAAKLEDITFLLQGTIYPDVLESGTKSSGVIKSHHNVGGLPDDVSFTLLEPLRELFKDEVRMVGYELGLDEQVVERQPFPGPGLGIRVIGEITREKLDILRDADAILREEIQSGEYKNKIWQYFAILPGNRSVGVKGDTRTYDYTVALRAVNSIDGMSAEWARIDLDTLAKISNRIVTEVDHVNRVVYDITSKPPSTIEWE